MWWLGLMLGLCALAAPWLAATGTAVWWQRLSKPVLASQATAAPRRPRP
ncbi:hypothetical protein LP420_40970 [Massilia sp. B-10]|nr:hypothetical protein LP420_40970 [Massilia sp. B-10]